MVTDAKVRPFTQNKEIKCKYITIFPLPTQQLSFIIHSMGSFSFKNTQQRFDMATHYSILDSFHCNSIIQKLLYLMTLLSAIIIFLHCLIQRSVSLSAITIRNILQIYLNTQTPEPVWQCTDLFSFWNPPSAHGSMVLSQTYLHFLLCSFFC